jgi:hypothetical protein
LSFSVRRLLSVAELLQSLRQSRRGLVGLAGAALVGIERGTDEVRAARGDTEIFVLNPEWGAGQTIGQTTCPVSKAKAHKKGGRCHGCRACHAHAKNKRFASQAAADQGRAHDGCLCAIESRLITQQAFARMFDTPQVPGFPGEFDLRR